MPWISDRWDVGDGEFGAMLSVSHQDKNYQEANTFDGTYDSVDPPGQPGTPTIRATTSCGRSSSASIYTLGETKRDSANLSLQWRPNDRATFYLRRVLRQVRRGLRTQFLDSVAGDHGRLIHAQAGYQCCPDLEFLGHIHAHEQPGIRTRIRDLSDWRSAATGVHHRSTSRSEATSAYTNSTATMSA